MPRPVTGRRPDSLFDNRYRYDYIYPRGRSGETLRAYDTQNGNQPVVIKRPALQDAPPIRAGQEVSILKEKRALEQLAGHPVLTELRHVGTFRVGGQLHQYIAMDMAQGETLEAMTLAGPLPELELLVILDNFLDLLHAAHDRHIVYNDVDAKHLFWDREHYHLKVIDWGNAVFLDTDSTAHANRSSDIFQVGQLIYFVLSGGHRLESGRADPATELGDNISPRWKSIINRATQPELNQRYPDINAFRQDLAELRRPLEKNRDMLVERARNRLANATSQSQLEPLRDTLHEALVSDPGYPAARTLLAEVETRLKQLEIQGDLDAVRIYIESGNAGRASTLINELLARMGDTEQPLLLCLLDICDQLQESPAFLPAALSPALEALLQGDAQTAARLLVTTHEPRPAARMQQFLVAERLALRMPGITLLRPHLVRLEQQLVDNKEQTRAIQTLITRLDESLAPGLLPVIRLYQRIADALATQETTLKATGAAVETLTALQRAESAADDIIELLEVVARNVLTDPSRAGNALWRAAAIDPGNPAFEALNNLLTSFHTELDSLRSFAVTDGGMIAKFLTKAQERLTPYSAEIKDPRFQEIVADIGTAISSWARAIDYLALGGRRPAIDGCRNASEAIKPLNPAVANWFDDFARRIEETQRVEYLSPNAALGRTLADGWEAWDRGRGGEAQAAGERAASLAATDGEKLAAKRLVGLGEVLSSWLNNDGAASIQRTDQAEDRVSALLLPEEEALRRKFAEQMPNMQIYLKAMARGVVEPLRDASAAAVRALFFHYVLRGILVLQQEKFDEAGFWRDAASKSLPNARLHPAYQALDVAITRRQLILEAVRALNNVRTVAGLTEARSAVRAPLAAAQLEYADQALRAIDDAVRRWTDGEFRTARQQLDSAIERTNAAEAMLGKDLTPFKTWLADLAASAELLQQARRTIEQAALDPTDEPDPAIAEAHQKLIDVTRRDLGESYTPQLRQWRDAYNTIRDTYLDKRFSKDEKLRLFDGHFSSMFIDRQPALPIFRHWQSLIRAIPDPVPITPSASKVAEATIAPPAVPTVPPLSTPNARSEATPEYVRETTPQIIDKPDVARDRPVARPASIPTRLLMIGTVVLALVVIGTMLLLLRGSSGTNLPITLVTSGRPTLPVVQATATNPPTNTLEPTFTPLPTNTSVPPTPISTATATTVRPVPTPTAFDVTVITAPSPTIAVTRAPSLTVPPKATNPPTLSSAQLQLTGETVPTLNPGVLPSKAVPTNPSVILPTLPPAAVSGEYDILEPLAKLPRDKITWDPSWFGPGGTGWQLGNSTVKLAQAPVINLGPDVLTPLLGTDAAQHIQRVDATFQLVNYDPAFIATGQVFFGVGLGALRGGSRADVRARLLRDTLFDVGMTFNGTYHSTTQLPITANPPQVILSVQRNDDKTLSLYVDGHLLGQSAAIYPPGTPLTIYLYTSRSSVMLNVTTLKVTLN